MSRLLTHRQRQVLQYHGTPAAQAARALHLSVDTVMRVRAELREQGVTPCSATTAAAPADGQLEMSFHDYDVFMRENRAATAPFLL